MDRQWHEQPKELRRPTLPHLNDMKVNVRGLVEALGMKQSREQYFFRSEGVELASLVNAYACVQGLKPIGSRKTAADAADAVVERQLNRLQSDRLKLSRSLAEREAVIERQRSYIEKLEAQLGLRADTGMTLRISEII
jgi:hypothetical protein